MNRDRLWILAAVAGMIVVALGGWFLGVSPIVAQASTADAQLASTRAANTTNDDKLATLKTQYADLGSLQKSLDSLRLSIPEEADASEFLQEITTVGAAHNVKLTSVTIDAATIYQAPTSATSTSGTATPTSTPTPTPTPTPTSTAATPTPTAAPTSGLVLIPVVIVVTGTFDNVRSFVGAIQGGSRLYFASSVELNTASSLTTGTLTGDIFTVAGTATPSATPTPTPTPTPVPTATPTSTPTPSITSTPEPTTTPDP
jgi:Tfp pilus assembly protein PilO